MPEKSRLRELIDTYVMAGRGKVEIDQLLAELEQRATTAKAMGAYGAGRDHGPAIAELVETLHGTRGALSNLIGAVLVDKQARARQPIAAAVASGQQILKRPATDAMPALTAQLDALSGILWHACITGDCPHSDALDCGKTLTAFISKVGLDLLRRPPPSSAPDTPETVAAKAKAARAIGDRFAELMKGGR